MTKTVIAYTDYKSPYAFLAKNPTYGLFDDFRAEIDWRPYTLDIPSYLGSAAVDTDGNDRRIHKRVALTEQRRCPQVNHHENDGIPFS